MALPKKLNKLSSMVAGLRAELRATGDSRELDIAEIRLQEAYAWVTYHFAQNVKEKKRGRSK